jgi:hypothetical protein
MSRGPWKCNSHVNAARRVADKARRDEFQQLLAKLNPEYVTKLRHDCLRMANEQVRGADPRAVVREAERHFESRVRFLMTEDRS